MSIPIKNKILTGFESLGIQPQKAVKLQPHFIPLQTDKYVTFSLDRDCNGNVYPLYQEVIDLVCPILSNHGITVVDVTLEESEKQNFTYVPETELDVNRIAWLLKNSLLHFGSHGWIDAAFATLSDKPIISLTSTPEFSNPVNPSIYFDLDTNVEVIAQKILDLLGIKEKVAVNTLHIGPHYYQRVVEIVPTQLFDTQIPAGSVLAVRLDLEPNYEVAAMMLRQAPQMVVTLDRDIPDIYQAILLQATTFKVFLNDKISPAFVEKLHTLGKNYALNVIGTEDEWTRAKAKYFDYNTPRFAEKVTRKELEEKYGIGYDTKVRSRKTIVDHTGEYISVYHRMKKFTIDTDKGITVGDALKDKRFLQESNNFMFYDYSPVN